MAKTKFKTIAGFIQTFPDDVREILETVRQVIKKAAQCTVEIISYQIPTFKLNGNYLIYFAGWKNHVSLYPVPIENENFVKELSKYKVGDGTIQFPLSQPMSLILITKIVKYRVKDSRNKEQIKQ